MTNPAAVAAVKRVRHIGIVVNDVDTCVRFWSDLGLTVVSDALETGPVLAEVLALPNVEVRTVKLEAPGGGVIELLKFLSHPGEEAWSGTATQTGLTHVALEVEDLESLERRLAEAGWALRAPPRRSADDSVTLAFCDGPEGLILELVQVARP